MKSGSGPDVVSDKDTSAPRGEPETPSPSITPPTRWPSWAPDTLGVLWVVVAGLAVLVPALIHGSSFGPFDALSQYGLTANPRTVVHNLNTFDQIDELIPWASQAWTQVHHGHLPLWNPYSALGLPLAFNWQSATFSVPALVGYLAPLRLDYTVQVAVIVVVAGTGAYVFGRVLRMGVLAAAFTATVFELSGALIAWLGWPVASVMSWAGWLCAASLLVVRGNRRARSIAFLAIVLAATVYAGQLDALIALLPMVAVFPAVLLVLRVPRFRGEGPILRPIVDLALAVAAGIGLSAPLALPALQLTAGSVRLQSRYPALPPRDVIHLVFATYDGAATSATWILNSGSYYPNTTAYVGVIVLVLAVLGVAMRWRRREVIAVTAVAVVSGLLVFTPPLVSLIDSEHQLGAVNWQRALAPMALALAVLAGWGLETLMHSYTRRAVRYVSGGGFLIAAVWLLYLWFMGRGHISGALGAIRRDSFFWPTIETALGIVVVGLLALAVRRGPSQRFRFGGPRGSLGLWAVLALFACETTFLIAVGGPPLPSSPQFFKPNAAIQELQRAVGSSVVGFGTGSCLNILIPQQGIIEEANIAFDIHEFADYDPSTPKTYNIEWTADGAKSPFLFTSWYCPGISTLPLARLYGVQFVLDPHGFRAPSGGVFDERIGNEDLYRMPGAALAALIPTSATGALPPPSAQGVPVRVENPNPSSWKVDTDAATEQVLRLRLTNVPGWHATIDGKPLVLHPFSRVMLQARIPPGKHTIELAYWPSLFGIGIDLAICSLFALVLGLFIGRIRTMRRTALAPSTEGH